MKSSIRLFIIVGISFIYTPLYAQHPPAGLQKKIHIASTEVRVDTLLQQLSRQSGVQFSFNSRRIGPSKKIQFQAKEQTVERVLDQLRQVLGIQYKIVGSHVILTDDPQKMIVANKTKLKGKSSPPKEKVNLGADPKTLVPVNAATGMLKDSVTVQKKETDTADHALQHTTAVLKDTNTLPVRKDTTFIVSPVVGHQAPQLAKSEEVKGNRLEKNANARSLLYHAGLEISPRGLGLNYVFTFGSSTSLEFSTGIGAGYLVTGKYFYYTLQLQNPAFYVSLNPKFFIGSGRVPSFYWGALLHYRTAQLFSNADKSIDTTARWISARGYTNAAFFFDIHGGYQLQLGERWRLNGHLGIGYSFSSRYMGLNHWYPAMGLRFTYDLKRKK